ncbi:MAG: lipid-A-disaccharide synthase, partial [Planctomycetes bacterium]|nr:lipid-A-disaccharide synthase [Planctomycetota bacterium]
MTQVPRTYLIVACEESGDNYGAQIARGILSQEPNARLIGIGGERMRAAGVDVRINMVDHAAMGFAEVVASIGFFLNAMRETVEMAGKEQADVAVLIDSPDFNLRIAPKLRAAGAKIAYFISPQMWIWREHRVEQVKRCVDKMLCIMPFEVDWYAERGMEATYVGHPLMDMLDFEAIETRAQALRAKALDGKSGPLFGILPGSRGFEIKRLLPLFLKPGRLLKQEYPHARFVIGCAKWLTPERARDMTDRFADIGLTLEFDDAHAVMAASDLLLCCSGTAALESALI